MNRREALQGLAAAAAAIQLADPARAAVEPPRTGLGVVTYCLSHHQQAYRQRTPPLDLAQPLELLEFCHGLGAGGVQVPLGNHDEDYAKRLRAKAESYGMFLESMANLPAQDADLDRFEAQIRVAVAAGIDTLRTVLLPGRRYEYFESLDQFRELDQQARQTLRRAAPIVEKHRVRLAVENHKTHLAADQAELLQRLGSPFVGSCVDTGNNVSLLEDPLEVVQKLAPSAFTVHLKDQAVGEYADGFLLGDVPLGQGALDLKRLVEILRQAQPQVRFGLELITREPLKVPCLTEKYWTTFPTLPGAQLARTLRFVRAHQTESLTAADSLPPVGREAVNVIDSLTYARDQLGL
jgi:sugar phosphate isomerase/epimerase